MPNLDISKAVSSDYTGTVSDVAVASQTIDTVSGSKETAWFNDKWSQQYGLFNSIPNLKSTLILKSIWVLGKGYTTEDPRTKVILEHISGNGKESFEDILFGLDVMRRIGGDSYAEIIRDEKTGTLLNLKQLDPGSMRVIFNPSGRIIRYEQVSKVKKEAKKFEPKDIFHLSNNRLGGSIHGISDIVALKDTIIADNESFVDTKKIMHFGARPLTVWKLKTDNAAKINAFVKKINDAKNLGEDMFVPDSEDLLSFEVVQTTPSSAIFQWRDDLRNQFYRNSMLPQIVPGASGGSTESESKTIYLAFERIDAFDQAYIERNVWNQLYLKIKLIPPATLSQDMQNDTGKDGQMLPQPSDTTAGVGR